MDITSTARAREASWFRRRRAPSLADTAALPTRHPRPASELDEAEAEVENLVVGLEDFLEPEVSHAPPVGAKPPRVEMTTTQEALNAVTMFGAPVYAAWYVREAGDCAPFTLVMLLVAVWLHLPWSVAYHAVCAVRKARPLPKGMKWDPVDNKFRRLDQTWIHISGSLMSYALSASIAYFAAAALFNGVSVANLWVKENTNAQLARRRRLTNVLICTIGQVAPLFPRGDVENGLGAITSFLAAAGLFVVNSKLEGWGHCLFHVLLIPYMAFLCRSAVAAETGIVTCEAPGVRFGDTPSSMGRMLMMSLR